MPRRLAESELILNDDGSIYHLNLLPNEIADTIITVGDQHRVSEVSQYFDRIEHKKQKREFLTHTGYIGQKRISVMSTGMGPGNIDIFMNELDALANIDLETRMIHDTLKPLKLIRLGTSGSLHPALHPGQLLVSEFAIGLDTTMTFYKNRTLELFKDYLTSIELPSFHHYFGECDHALNKSLIPSAMRGITLTAPGFYAAQNRSLRIPYSSDLKLNLLHGFKINNTPLTNLEMETSSIYYFANLMGHAALSINCILANRIHGTFSKDPKADVKAMIKSAIEEIAKLP